MRQSRAIEVSAGMFVLLGFAAIWFLVTQITNRETVVGNNYYDVIAKFENIGSLKVGAPVSMSGVNVGRVESIALDQNIYKAVVHLRIDAKFNRIPEDSDAAIMTAGLLGGQYVGLTAGPSEKFLKSGDQISFVQDALVLENLINQLVASMAGKKDTNDSSDSSSAKKDAK